MDTMMIEAVKAGDLARVDELLTEDPSLVLARDAVGVSVLLLARYRSATAVVVRLLAAGATVDVAEAGHHARGPRTVELAEAAALGDADRLAALLAADPGAVNARSADGFTPLHYAAFFGGVAVARILLDLGADPNVRSDNDQLVMPLHSAVAGQSEVALLLIEHGADVNVKQRHGWTPLHTASNEGHEKVVDALIAAGADPAATNDDGITAADLAEKRGHSDLAARLRRLATSTESR